MTLHAAGPAGTGHDPFVGAPADAGEPLTLPAERYRELGATDAELAELQTYFGHLTRAEQRDAVAWHDEIDDVELVASIARFREVRDALVALGGLTDEQRAELDALTEEERDALAALTPEERAELVALTPPAGAEGDAAGSDGAPAGEQPGEQQSAAQAGAQEAPADDAAQPDGQLPAGDPSAGQEPPADPFTPEHIGALTIPQIEQAIADGTVTAEVVLAAERSRGAEARKTLIAKLTSE